MMANIWFLSPARVQAKFKTPAESNAPDAVSSHATRFRGHTRGPRSITERDGSNKIPTSRPGQKLPEKGETVTRGQKSRKKKQIENRLQGLGGLRASGL
jgi:hypothetical protein